jgi:hypothetical protein
LKHPNKYQVSRLQEETGADGSTCRENTFYVITPDRRFAFSADSRKEKDEWMQLIDECRGLLSLPQTYIYCLFVIGILDLQLLHPDRFASWLFP